MSILNSILTTSQMGEPARLDYIIREHEKLEARVESLVNLLRSKGLITDEEVSELTANPANLPG
jgi:hypothetical protein